MLASREAMRAKAAAAAFLATASSARIECDLEARAHVRLGKVEPRQLLGLGRERPKSGEHTSDKAAIHGTFSSPLSPEGRRGQSPRTEYTDYIPWVEHNTDERAVTAIPRCRLAFTGRGGRLALDG